MSEVVGQGGSSALFRSDDNDVDLVLFLDGSRVLDFEVFLSFSSELGLDLTLLSSKLISPL